MLSNLVTESLSLLIHDPSTHLSELGIKANRDSSTIQTFIYLFAIMTEFKS